MQTSPLGDDSLSIDSGGHFTRTNLPTQKTFSQCSYQLGNTLANVPSHLRNVSGKLLADKFIYNDVSCFKLCSANKMLEGVLSKGSNMKFSLGW